MSEMLEKILEQELELLKPGVEKWIAHKAVNRGDRYQLVVTKSVELEQF